jgi:hypothetical protein
VSAGIVQAVAALAARCRKPRNRIVATRRERSARAAIGMPAHHPERITRELPRGQEEWLAALCTALWPDDEYADITNGTWKDDQP